MSEDYEQPHTDEIAETDATGQPVEAVVIRRCPVCRSIPSRYIEFWTGHSIAFCAVNGAPEEMGNMEPGEPDRVDACCDRCGHQWRLRGVWSNNQIRSE